MNYYVANLNLLSLVSLAATLYLLCVYCVGIAYEKLNRAQAPVIAKARKLALAWWIPHACVLVMLAMSFATTPAHVIDLLLRAVLLTWLFHLNVCRASEAEALAALYRADNARAADRTRAAASVR